MTLALSSCPACQRMLTLSWVEANSLAFWCALTGDHESAAWLRRALREGWV